MEKQALDDLDQDALSLAEVIADQVGRLGRQARTKKAIYIFGHVGHQVEASQVSANEAARHAYPGSGAIRQRSLSHIVLEILSSWAESAVTSLMMWSFAAVRRLWKVSSAHSVILALLVLSLSINLLHSSRFTATWWNERQVRAFMSKMGVGPDPIMTRSIYLESIDDIVFYQGDYERDSSNEWLVMLHSMSLPKYPQL